jgi:hypothetical protein
MILILLLLFFFSPLTAWAYFDPGFGGYLINSILSLIVTGFAFVSASIIYFFRTVIARKFRLLRQKHEKFCLIVLLSALGTGSFFLGAYLHHTFHKPSGDHPPFSGARIIDSQHISPGYDLYNGDLIDEKGKIIKQWPASYGVIDKNGNFYGLLRQNEPPWKRYAWDDRVIWMKDFPIHNGIWPTPQGTIVVFTKEIHDYNDYKVGFDVILEFDKNGRQLQRYSFWDHREEFKPYHAQFEIDVPPPVNIPWFGFNGKTYDYFHLNCLSIIPPNPLEGKDPAFRRGNWLVSLLHGSMVFILDQDTKKILWHMVADDIEGSLQGQHSVSMLTNGNILLFENGMERKASRILIIDPLTLQIKWQYSHPGFFSENIGFVEALPNGNLLVTSSQQGHVFELTPDKKIVWEFYKPEEKNDTKDKIYSMIRYPKEMIEDLLQKGGP